MSATSKSLKTVTFFYLTSYICYMVTQVSKISATLGRSSFTNNFDKQRGEYKMSQKSVLLYYRFLFQYSLQQHVAVLLTQKRYYVSYGYVILRTQRNMLPFQFSSLLE